MRLSTAKELPGPDALGLTQYKELFASEPPIERCVRVAPGRDGRERWRLPLPGTPGEDGHLTGSPRGAGTGWLELWRWKGAAAGEDAWNALCQLRARGVATPMPLLVASRRLLGRRSLVLVRELAEHTPWLEQWSAVDAAERRRLERALAALLARLARAEVRLDGLGLEDVRVAPDEEAHGEDEIDCAAKAITSLRQRRAQHSLRPNRLPSLALGEIAGAELGAWSADARAALGARLAEELGPARTPRLELRLLRALSAARGRDERHAFVRAALAV